MKAILVKGLTKVFKSITAVNHISFDVAPGEVYGFLGPNGAGKTTTIRMLTGQLLPTEGTAKVAGYDFISEPEKLKMEIGVVFEYQNLYVRLSAKENLNFMRNLYGISRSRVDEVLKIVGLSDQVKIPLKTFSNGMKQRLLIARSLLHEPSILFLDEPTKGLDPSIARSIRLLIEKLANQNCTIFLTTHYMEEADRLCDRIAIIDQGKIIATGSPIQLKELYGPTLEDVFINLTEQESAGVK